jgi:hypothetical protein
VAWKLDPAPENLPIKKHSDLEHPSITSSSILVQKKEKSKEIIGEK